MAPGKVRLSNDWGVSLCMPPVARCHAGICIVMAPSHAPRLKPLRHGFGTVHHPAVGTLLSWPKDPPIVVIPLETAATRIPAARLRLRRTPHALLKTMSPLMPTALWLVLIWPSISRHYARKTTFASGCSTLRYRPPMSEETSHRRSVRSYANMTMATFRLSVSGKPPIGTHGSETELYASICARWSLPL